MLLTEWYLTADVSQAIAERTNFEYSQVLLTYRQKQQKKTVPCSVNLNIHVAFIFIIYAIF